MPEGVPMYNSPGEKCEHAIVFESLDLFVGQRVDPFVLMFLCY